MDHTKLHKLCHEGKTDKIRDFLNEIEDPTELFNRRAGIFGYTPLHEAVSANKYNAVSFLIQRGADVNVKATNGLTPLHLAATVGYPQCVKALLYGYADITLKDQSGKSAMELAVQCSNGSVIRLLRSEEIVEAARNNSDNLTELLRVNIEMLEPECLERALMAAVDVDNHFNIGKLIIKGASEIKQALERAQERSKFNAIAMLLLVLAAQQNDRDLVLKLFGANCQHPMSDEQGFSEAQSIVSGGRVSTIIAIEIARRHQNLSVREELIFHTDVNHEEGTVYWHGLRLQELELSWLRRIHWVKKLRLARNGFRTLPNEMASFLKQVIKLDLQHNELTSIPPCLLKLPNISELILSHNRLSKLPEVHKWSQSLTLLNLSYNKLTTLPPNTSSLFLTTLNLSYNRFATIPSCVSSFIALKRLDLSFNQDLCSLPQEMGHLHKLVALNLEGLDHLTDPPRNLHKNTSECMKYLKHKLYSPRKFYQMKLLILGNASVGKTTLVSRLQGIEIDSKKSQIGGARLSTSEWQYSSGFFQQKYTFHVYDFDGLDEYSVPICSYFFSDRSIYLLVWKIQDGERGVAELRPWLDRILAFVKSGQSSCILIIGTGLDLVKDENRPQVDILLHKVTEMCGEYSSKLSITEVLNVGLMNTLENVNSLKKAIYTSAASCKEGSEAIMGREIPASFLRLNKELKDIQSEVSQGLRPPVMSVENLKDLVLALKLPDIVINEETFSQTPSTFLRSPSLFLTEVGTIAHYDDKSNSMNDLYFIDQNYLYQLMVAIIKSPAVINGILQSSDIAKLLLSENFKLSPSHISHIVYLMSYYKIALPIDSQNALIPSMLPHECPANVDPTQIRDGASSLCYSRYFKLLPGNVVPEGFWGLLICHIIHKIPRLYKSFLKSLNSKDTKILKEKEANYTENETTFDLPNICLPYCNDEDDSSSSGELMYWREGISYKSTNASSFCVEPLKNPSNEKTGIEISVSPDKEGTQIMCQLIDIIRDILQNCYSISEESYEDLVPCYECRKTRCEKPYEFQVDWYVYLNIIGSNVTDTLEVTCDTNNHIVSLKDIMPELLLCDINGEKEIILKPDAVMFQQNEFTLIDGFGDTFYHGLCNDKKVAVKKYSKEGNKDGFLMLRNEVQLLYTTRGCPLITDMVGVVLHPYMALVVESAPLGSLTSCLIESNTTVSQIVIFRIATQVASALKFLHQQGIVYGDLDTSKVHVWSLDEKSLCHSKLAGNDTTSRLSPLGSFGSRDTSTNSVPAPEVLYDGKYKSVYNHKIDVFSFGMLLYQMITRYSHPFNNSNISREDLLSILLQGERPSFNSSPSAKHAYFSLIRLIEACWSTNPIQRPDMIDIMMHLTQIMHQCIMSVEHVPNKFSLRCGCHALVSSKKGINTECPISGDLWICSDSSDGIEMRVYDVQTMTKRSKSFASGNQVQCARLCGDHVWVCSRSGIEFGVIDIFNANDQHDLIHNIRLKENTVSCITCSVDEKRVFMGTLEGYCFLFDTDIAAIQSNAKPHYCYISEHAIDGIVATHKHVWLSHTYYIFFLSLETLKVEHSFKRDPKMNAFVGHLALGNNSHCVWSAHLGGSVFSGWDSEKETHLFDVNIHKVMTKNVNCDIKESDAIITCITPVLDTVWVGMATGHILLFHDKNLLTYFRPYTVYVRFLIPVAVWQSSKGELACKSDYEKCMVVSGAKGFQSSLFDLTMMNNSTGINNTSNSNTSTNSSTSNNSNSSSTSVSKEDSSGVIILWEAHTSTALREMIGIQNEGPEYLSNCQSMARLVKEFDFNDVLNGDSIEGYELTNNTTSLATTSKILTTEGQAIEETNEDTSDVKEDHSGDTNVMSLSTAKDTAHLTGNGKKEKPNE